MPATPEVVGKRRRVRFEREIDGREKREQPEREHTAADRKHRQPAREETCNNLTIHNANLTRG